MSKPGISDRVAMNRILGTIRVGPVNVDGRFTRIHEQPNLYMKSGADLLAGLIAGRKDWQIQAMYLEFSNNGGSLGAGLDFLRVSINPPVIRATDGTYNGNEASFFAISSGTEGIHGTPFSAASGSQVYGGALVATPDPNTPANDIILARTYWESAPVDKEVNQQVGVQWVIRFI